MAVVVVVVVTHMRWLEFPVFHDDVDDDVDGNCDGDTIGLAGLSWDCPSPNTW